MAGYVGSIVSQTPLDKQEQGFADSLWSLKKPHPLGSATKSHLTQGRGMRRKGRGFGVWIWVQGHGRP